MATPKKKAQAKTARKKVTHKVDYKNTVEVQGVDPIDEVKLAAKVTGIETPKVNSAALTKLRQAKAKRDEASKQQEPAKTASINTDQPKQKKGGKTISGEVEKIEGKV